MTLQTVLHSKRLTPVGLRLALRRIGVNVSKDTMTGKSTAGLVSCLTDCAEYIHADNLERGWWTDLNTGEPLQRNVGELLMLMVSELAEIPTANWLAVTDDKLPDRLMFEVELADCAIRIFDAVGGLNVPTFTDGYLAGCNKETVDPVEINTALFMAVRHLAAAMECHRKSQPEFGYWLGRALHQVFYTGRAWSLSVADAISEKLEYNQTRIDHSPEHRRTNEGKRY